MSQLTVKIEHCNSIDSAEIAISLGNLNIKYGPNGIGKSTIAKAIIGAIRADGSLSELVQFKNRHAAGGAKAPSISGVSNLSSALVFDEAYVNQFVFQQDEVVKNSFDIFIRTEDYVAATKEIDDLFSGIKKAFADNADIENTLKDMKELRDAFGTPTRDGGIPKTAKVLKAFGTGNKIENIPEALRPFELFIKSKIPSKWIGWQIKGKEFLELGDVCPYCATDLAKPEQKATALAVEQQYDATAIGHLNTLKDVIERLGKYFHEACQENLQKVINAKFELTAPQKSFLSSLRTAIDALISQLEGLRTISFFSLRDVDQIEKKLESLKIDLGMIDKLDSAETRSVCDPINVQLAELIGKVGILQGRINVQKSKIKKAIEQNQSGINTFLKSAGYKYTVEIVAEPETYKMKLLHQDLSSYVEGASKHLSYGEKNAFAIVLFMYQVLSENPDLVILDDPISSFDKNKKFAILHELFRGKASLKGRTTLMLTHDIEPAIDIVKATSGVFQGSHPSASFLSCRNGVVSEVSIKSSDIRTFAQICKDVLVNPIDPICKCIFLRRHYEILDMYGLEYNLLASLFKKRSVPTVQSDKGTFDMTTSEKANAQVLIQALMPDFNYDKLLAEVADDEVMKKKFLSSNVGYEKIQLFRIIHGKHNDHVIAKFVNESYHIENEYVMQLDPYKFEYIPEYVVQECTQLLAIS